MNFYEVMAKLFGLLLAVCLMLIAVFLIGLHAASFYHEYRERKPAQVSETVCKDGIVQQGAGNDWKPVYIRKSKRTIPCEEENDN